MLVLVWFQSRSGTKGRRRKRLTTKLRAETAPDLQNRLLGTCFFKYTCLLITVCESTQWVDVAANSAAASGTEQVDCYAPVSTVEAGTTLKQSERVTAACYSHFQCGTVKVNTGLNVCVFLEDTSEMCLEPSRFHIGNFSTEMFMSTVCLLTGPSLKLFLSLQQESKAFPGLMEVLQDLTHQIKRAVVRNRSSYKYFENISSN